MRRTAVLRLVAGFRRFHKRYFEAANSPYRRLNGNQSPKTMVIGCSDSRVDPAIITSAGPGELFVVRNVANLVPPYETGGGRHGTSAALEFAVTALKVENIIVLGHRQCGGIRALVTDDHQADEQSFISKWMSVARPALERSRRALPDAELDRVCQHCELESIKTSVENLMSFPFVRTAVETRGMQILGAYFDLESGELRELDNATGEFNVLKL